MYQYNYFRTTERNMRFELKIEDTPPTEEVVSAWLNYWDSMGWELVTLTPHRPSGDAGAVMMYRGVMRRPKKV